MSNGKPPSVSKSKDVEDLGDFEMDMPISNSPDPSIMEFEFVDAGEFEKVENDEDNDVGDSYIQDYESESTEEEELTEVELLGDDGFIDSEYENLIKEKNRGSLNKGKDSMLSSTPIDNKELGNPLRYGRCICTCPFTSEGWCPDCQRNIYKQKQEPWWSDENLNILSYLVTLQDRAHCSFCTLDWIDYHEGFKEIRGFGENLIAELLFSKINFKDIPGIDSTHVFLKNIGREGCNYKDYLRDLGRSDCIYETGNILPYYGITYNLEENVNMIVMPYVPNGNLRDYLSSPRNRQSLPWLRRLTLLHNLATALADLHDKKVIHRGLHPNNILIGKDIESPIISDVGLFVTKPKIFGVLPYIDPSAYAGDYCLGSDVYSFAFVMYEVATFNLPFSHVAHDENLAEEIFDGLRPRIPDDVPIYLAELMRMCWDAQPTERPTMRQVANIFKYWRNHQLDPNLGATISHESSASGKEDTTLSDSFRNAPEHPSFCPEKPNAEAFYHGRLISVASKFKGEPRNKVEHRQKPSDDPIKKYIVPYEEPFSTPNGFVASVQDTFTCTNCDTHQRVPTWWCNSCETLRLRDKFGSWTSGNKSVDQFIQYTQTLAPSREGCLEWIPFSDFEVIRQIGQGGFSRVLHAIWKSGPMIRWNQKTQAYDRKSNVDVALKQLKDSQHIRSEFFQELIAHLHCESNDTVIRCYGVTQDPESKEYIMVTDYAKKGDLRTYIHNRVNEITWRERCGLLKNIVNGLKKIHEEGWIHGDLHTGNLLLEPCSTERMIAIGDLGMCRPANYVPSSEDKKICGVIPYMAPELFEGGLYTKESDIYSFGTIMWEISSGALPFDHRPHDLRLIKEIQNGLRLGVVCNVPEYYVELMWRCWDANPEERPNANEISIILASLSETDFDDYGLGGNDDLLGLSCYDSAGSGEEGDDDRGKRLDKGWVVNNEAFYASRLFDVSKIVRDLEKLDLDDDEALIKEGCESSLKCKEKEPIPEGFQDMILE